jgi:hypothetical protein
MTDKFVSIRVYIAEKHVPSVTVENVPIVKLPGDEDPFAFSITLEQANALYWQLSRALAEVNSR